jgi:hypothetical protein
MDVLHPSCRDRKDQTDSRFLTYDRLAKSVFLTKDHGRYYLRGRWYFKGKARVRNIESYGPPPYCIARSR